MKFPLPLLLVLILIFEGCLDRANETRSAEALTESNSEISPREEGEEMDAISEQWGRDYLSGKFIPAEHPDFVAIDQQFASKGGMYMQREAYKAFMEMHESALKDGIKLVIRSASRNFEAQKRIWEEKWWGQRKSAGKNAKEVYPDPLDRALKILQYSSMPGTSRHHWGTDIDLNSFDSRWFESGEGLELYLWLKENAGEFGFCQPYTALGENRQTGYQEEKWHWSYIPLSSKMTSEAKKVLNNSSISGFAGHETASEIGIVENYILGIDPSCLINQ